MNTKQDIQDFVSQRTIAMAGLSRDEKAFSANIKKELQSKGYRILAVNPNAASIGGETCYPNLAALPEKVGAVLIVTPAKTQKARDKASIARCTGDSFLCMTAPRESRSL